MKRTQLTLTEDQLKHLFVTFHQACAAGSENQTDYELRHLLARALERRGLGCPSSWAVVTNPRDGWPEPDEGEE